MVFDVNRFYRILVVVVVVTVAVGLVGLPTPGFAQTEYSGMEQAGPHQESVRDLAERRIFTGTECGPNLFCPTQPIQRWVMAVWLIRVLDDAPPPTVTTRFTDVDNSQWWAPT